MLHRLPSKNVVATSVLSKRWRSLWKEVNRFSYDGGTVGREYWRFALFISKLSNLESLDLKISPYRTNKFINYLVNIEKAQSRHGLQLLWAAQKLVYQNVMVFTIDVPTLRRLCIDNTCGKSRPEGVHGFVITTPSLRWFSIRDRFSNYLKFEDMPELVKASVSVVCESQPEMFLGCLASTQSQWRS